MKIELGKGKKFEDSVIFELELNKRKKDLCDLYNKTSAKKELENSVHDYVDFIINFVISGNKYIETKHTKYRHSEGEDKNTFLIKIKDMYLNMMDESKLDVRVKWDCMILPSTSEICITIKVVNEDDYTVESFEKTFSIVDYKYTKKHLFGLIQLDAIDTHAIMKSLISDNGTHVIRDAIHKPINELFS